MVVTSFLLTDKLAGDAIHLLSESHVSGLNMFQLVLDFRDKDA